MTPIEYLELWLLVTSCGCLVLLIHLVRQGWRHWRRRVGWQRLMLDRRDVALCVRCHHHYATQNSDAADKRTYCTETCETKDIYAHFI